VATTGPPLVAVLMYLVAPLVLVVVLVLALLSSFVVAIEWRRTWNGGTSRSHSL
jgi:hypothetical protein